MKKIILIVIIIAATLQAAYFGYLIYSNFIVTGNTGRVASPPSQNQIDQGNAIYTLQKSLPLTTTNFAIVRYDYSNGKFIVQSEYQGADLQSVFDSWYQASGYTAIPKSMFSFP